MANTNKLIQERIALLKQMDNYIREIGDEEIWMDWIAVGVPDEATEEDYEFIAEYDNEWVCTCNLFGRLIGCTEGSV